MHEIAQTQILLRKPAPQASARKDDKVYCDRRYYQLLLLYYMSESQSYTLNSQHIIRTEMMYTATPTREAPALH
jgi:hypothetical protein